MHLNILTEQQKTLLPLIKSLANQFGLVGGTAIALQLGHRESIDFDLFQNAALDIFQLKKAVNKYFTIERVQVENIDEYTIQVNGVKLTFLNYPFGIEYTTPFLDVINMPDLLTLGAMKAFALGKRSKWKDYVDLYFIFQKHTLKDVSDRAKEIFENEFSEKLFREQLSYYNDLDYSESVVYVVGKEVDQKRIKEKLTQISVSNP